MTIYPQSYSNVMSDYKQCLSDYQHGNQGNYQSDFTKMNNDLKTMNNDPSVPQYVKDQVNAVFAPQAGEDPSTYLENISSEIVVIHWDIPGNL